MFRTVFFCLCFWRLDGVFYDEDESKVMMKGESVTLDSDLTEIEDDDVIQWKYEDTLIAEINKRADRIAVYDDVLDGIFRDRLKMNNQTGSLTIINVTEEIGDYSLHINGVRKRKINIGSYGSVTSVSVKEGESLTLNSDLTEIKGDRPIQWRFGDEDTVIAEINKRADRIAVYDDVLDGIFRDRLKMNNQTGSLTITNIRPEHAGRYERLVQSSASDVHLAVFVEISVEEGESLTVDSGLTEIKDYEWIRWMFGDENILIAEINVKADRITVHDDYLGRFRDRLKMDNQTGSLTVTDIRPEHAGHYKLQTFQYGFSLKAFRVSVSACLPVPVISSDCSSPSSSSCSSSPSGSHPNPISNQTQHLNISQLCHTCSDSVHCCGPTEAVIRLVLSALVGAATVIILVYNIRSRRAEPDRAHIHTSET